MNISYLVWLEDLGSPILRGQVIELLKELVRSRREHTLHAFLFQPLHRVILHRKAIAAACTDLRASGILPVVIPCLVVPRIDHFRARWFVMPLIFLHSFPALLFLTLAHRIDILHCRSYPVTWAAVSVKRLTGAKVVFDPRSGFPEENLTAGFWTKDSLTHRAWKSLERKLLAESDVTVAILETYVSHFRTICPEARFQVIPNNVDTNRFTRDDTFRKTFRHDTGITDDTIVFCYSGSLGAHWHNPEIYASFMQSLRDLSVPHMFLFVTPEKSLVETTFRHRGVSPEEYRMVSSDFADVPGYLSAADFGTILLQDFKLAMGIKTVEYLSMGLPVITDTNAAGAKEIVDRHGVGLVIEDRDRIDLKAIETLIKKKGEMSQKCRRVATERFSTTRVAAQYALLYDTFRTGAEKGRRQDEA
ncbi:MAG: glycosyltransferase [Candidatus Eisenbacteria bacterium]